MGKNTITMVSDIQDITEECIGLLTHTEELRVSKNMEQAYEFAKKNFDVIRKLMIGNMMYDKTLICVSGLQGAGKTTLMKNFYGLDDAYFAPTKGRGETIPVLITEKEDVQKPVVYATCIAKNENGVYKKMEKEIAPGEEFDKASKGNDETIMYLEMQVPYRHTYNSNISFMLLPGFERDNEYLNTLLEFSVNSSDSAVFVFSENSFAGVENSKWMNKIQEKLKDNVVYAISGADGSNDGNKQAKETCLKVLQIPKEESDRVICVSSYTDAAENEPWINQLKNALEKYAYTGGDSKLRKNSKYIFEEVSNLKVNLYQILEILNSDVTEEMRDFHNDSLLKVFDKTKEKKRAELKRNLERRLDKARQDSCINLETEYAQQPKLKQAKRVFFGNSVKEQFVEPRKMVVSSLNDESGNLRADQQIVNALEDSLSQWERDGNSNAGWLIETTENDRGEIELIAGEDLEAMSAYVTALLAPRKKGDKLEEISYDNPKKLMGALTEFGTYYFGIMYYDRFAENTHVENYYQPSFSELKLDRIVEGGKSSKRFAAGMLGIMGIDILGDGTLDMVSQMAVQFGVALPVATMASVCIVGTGALSVVSKDINRMVREDCAAAKMTVNNIYDDIVKNVLDDYDVCMQRIREKIEENLDDLGRDGKKIMNVYNAKVEVNNALDMLDRMYSEYLGGAYGIM